jgi:hypothetical protein
MDPYLELEYWSGFTVGFIHSLATAMLPELLPRYEVLVEEYIYVAHEDIRTHGIRPDITVVSGERWRPSVAQSAAVQDVATEQLEYPEFEPRTQRHLKVLQRPSRRVVTVIEFLSPTNKRLGEDFLDAYLEKRSECVAAGCNLVEIDLLRGGERLPMSGELPPGDYFVYVGRADRKPRCQVIGWPWRARFPVMPIPLLPQDGELKVELQAVFQSAYEQAFYDRRLPYDRPLDPPLPPDEEKWAKERLRECGLLSI